MNQGQVRFEYVIQEYENMLSGVTKDLLVMKAYVRQLEDRIKELQEKKEETL